jgi:hypothetical protein
VKWRKIQHEEMVVQTSLEEESASETYRLELPT